MTKTALVYSAARETLEAMFLNEQGVVAADHFEVQLEVTRPDVKAAWSLVSVSIEVMKNFKVNPKDIFRQVNAFHRFI